MGFVATTKMKLYIHNSQFNHLATVHYCISLLQPENNSKKIFFFLTGNHRLANQHCWLFNF